MPRIVPVLEIGGTHVTAALVAADDWTVRGDCRIDIDGHAPADELLDGFARAGRALDAADAAVWGVAMPDPFDYEHGIGRFHDVAKFESLDGVDVRAGLLERLPGRDLVFCNDADAFAVGESVAGAGTGGGRVMGMTLGTGVGSGWVVAGRIVDPVVPPGGRAHQLFVRGQPLEEVVSRRAIRAAYASATGDQAADVREIAGRARGGEAAAAEVLAHALRSLGFAIAPPIRDFGADMLVVGGSMAGSWDLFEPWFREGAMDVRLPPIRVAARPDAAALIGAAHVALAGRSG